MDSAGKGMNVDEEHSYFDAYQEAGLYFDPAKKNRDLSGLDLINAALKPTPVVVGNEQKLEPELTFMKGNDELVWQISHLRFAEWRGNVVDKDPPEKAQEKRRHLVDCLAYILLDEPYFAEPKRANNLTGNPGTKGSLTGRMACAARRRRVRRRAGLTGQSPPLTL